MNNTETIQKDFEASLDGFLKTIQKQSDDYHDRVFEGRQKTTFTLERGRKYIKVVSNGQSVYCFVDSTNGDILKAGTWKAPQKNGKRGSIFAPDFGLSCTDVYGLKYLR